MDELIKEKNKKYDEAREKNTYRVSIIVITLISFLMFQIMFINENVTIKLIGLFLTLLTFALSFISTIFSKKILYFGDKFQKASKVLYYIALPIIIVNLNFLYMLIGYLIISSIDSSGWDLLGFGLLFWLTVIIFGTLTITPYLQTLLVLIVRSMSNMNSKR